MEELNWRHVIEILHKFGSKITPLNYEGGESTIGKNKT